MVNLKDIPEKPGVYLFKKKQKILYVGKAKNLKNRVLSYFKENHSNFKTKILIEQADKVEWIITKNEVEALILENNLIKKHKPKFNIKLVDDKTYPYLKINFSNEFPAIQITRKKIDDNSLYFGPYISAFKLKSILNFVNKNFKLRKCSEKKFKTNKRPCLYYQMNLCMAPCSRKINKKEYDENLKEVIMFLKGENRKLIDSLKIKMKKMSKDLKFEKAAYFRDLINAIEELSQTQAMEENSFYNKDIFYYEKYEDIFHIIVLRIKKGKLLDTIYFTLKDKVIINGSIIDEIIPKFYSNRAFLPEKIIVQEKLNFKLLSDYFKSQFSKKIEIVLPESDNDINLMEFAKENIQERIKLFNLKKDIKFQLQKKLKLKKTPIRIDAFDISTHMGKSSVGTRVTFIDNKAEKSFYRKYKIKSVNENMLNDFAMIEEVVSRSCKEYIKTGKFPDLILIDGGKGQLNSALKSIINYNLQDKIDVIALAKDKENIYDRVYLPNRKNFVNLSKYPEIISFLMRIRDEVHRFSIAFHTKREEKKTLSSILLEIKGIGKIRAKKLYEYFKSIDKIKGASLEELNSLPFLNENLAENIYNFFKHQ
jgi:excinuclease ABC subunit C